MAEIKTYSEKLKDPRWQRKRLEIMQRDNFTCQGCGDDENTLSVHHKYYIYGKEPWDYPDSLLVTLCELCHGDEEESKGIISDFTRVLLNDGYLVNELPWLLEVLRQLPPGHNGIYYISQGVKIYEKCQKDLLTQISTKSLL